MTATSAAEPAGSAYERVAYPGYAYASTHPAHLEAVGRLLGLDPTPAASCRVLELGCGDGGNALSIAATLPGAEVLGADAAAVAVARGEQLARAAGLDNVALRAADFAALAEEAERGGLGRFDYVIAHGVYSWIPPAARVALLGCVARCLAPQGIAFLSYNAYPGSYLRDMARDVLRYHLRDVAEPQARVAGAHELMETIVAIEDPSPYARVLREQLGRMLGTSDALLFHDDLADVSTPFYLHEVVEHAAAHGLRFLAEADLFESVMRDVPESAERLMATLPDDAVVREQYLDFFKNRMFRQTLLCRAGVPVRRALDEEAIERLWLSSPACADEEGETFTTPQGFTMTTSEPHVCATMHALIAAWPAAAGFAELLRAARDAVGAEVPGELVAGRLREVLLQAHLARVVELHGCPPPLAPGGVPGERPCASALARAQLASGSGVVSSLRHTNVRLDAPGDAELLALLDGTRDRATLAAALGRAASELDAALARIGTLGLLC